MSGGGERKADFRGSQSPCKTPLPAPKATVREESPFIPTWALAFGAAAWGGEMKAKGKRTFGARNRTSNAREKRGLPPARGLLRLCFAKRPSVGLPSLTLGTTMGDVARRVPDEPLIVRSPVGRGGVGVVPCSSQRRLLGLPPPRPIKSCLVRPKVALACSIGRGVYLCFAFPQRRLLGFPPRARWGLRESCPQRDL